MKNYKETKNILYRIAKDFPIEGVNFIDLTPTLTEGDYFQKTATLLKEMILQNEEDIDYIISPDARGFIWGSYVAALLEKPLIPIRKHGKLPESSVMFSTKDTTEYSNIELDLPLVDLDGKKCLFIDDVYATGGTFKACQKLVSQANGTLTNAYVVLDILISQDHVNSLITSNDLKID